MSAVESTVDAWASRIRPHLAQTVESIVAAGRELIDAKAALPHGDFGPLLEQLGLGQQMANRFMRVAAHPVLSKCSPVNTLPASVSVLDELTRLPVDELEGALDRGDIGPSTTRRQAKELRHEADGQPDLDEAEARGLTEQLRSAVDRLAVLCVAASPDDAPAIRERVARTEAVLQQRLDTLGDGTATR